MGRQPGKDRTPGGGKEFYETDPDFYEICDYEFRFGLDAAASDINKKCKAFLSKEDDALTIDWINEARHTKYGVNIWLNPPYSRGMVPQFLQKCWEVSQYGATVVCLVHTCTDTKYWDNWVWDKAAEVRHIHGRLRFWLDQPDKNGNYGNISDLPHSMIVYRPYYLGCTFQSIWKWKVDYIERFGKLPIRDIKSRDKQIIGYMLPDGTREVA